MPSNIPLWTFGVVFRLRLVTFTEQAHHATDISEASQRG